MTNFEKTNLLCRFFRENPECAMNLFKIGEQPKINFELNVFDVQIPFLQKIWWIFSTYYEDQSYFGICNENTIVRYKDSWCELSFVCEGLEHLPFWFKNKLTYNDENEEEIEYYQKYLQPSLDKYIDWCNQNNIILDWENAPKELYYSEDLTENPFYFPIDYNYTDPKRKIYLDIEITNFEEIKIVEDIKLPLIHNLPPCIEPEFVYSGAGDIYQEFFEFSQKYPRSANDYETKNEDFGLKYFNKFRNKIEKSEREQEKELQFIRIPQRTLHGF